MTTKLSAKALKELKSGAMDAIDKECAVYSVKPSMLLKLIEEVEKGRRISSARYLKKETKSWIY